MTETSKVLEMVPSKTDAELASELRAQILTAAKPLAEIMENARKSGLAAAFNVTADAFGRFNQINITISKPL